MHIITHFTWYIIHTFIRTSQWWFRLWRGSWVGKHLELTGHGKFQSQKLGKSFPWEQYCSRTWRRGRAKIAGFSLRFLDSAWGGKWPNGSNHQVPLASQEHPHRGRQRDWGGCRGGVSADKPDDEFSLWDPKSRWREPSPVDCPLSTT